MSGLKHCQSWFVSMCLVGAMCSADSAAISRPELLTNLRQGGYVILMRHASSPREAPDSSHVNPDNTKGERQLDETGVRSARAFGHALHRLGIPIGQVLSSPTYRALQTVEIARLGQPTTFPELGDGGQSMQADQNGTRAAWLKSRAAQTPRARTNTLIVTHYPNIVEAFGQSATGLGDGEALILKPDGNGGSQLVERIPIDDWATLGRAQ